MWFTERSVLELAYRHAENLARAHAYAADHFTHGPSAVLPPMCCRGLARLGHWLMLAGTRMEIRYSQAGTA